MDYLHPSGHRFLWWLVVPVAVVAVGCSAPSRIRLEQPHLPESQRILELLSEQVYWSEGDGTRRVLAEIPLPGAGTGRPTYLLYLRVPAAADVTGGQPAASADVRGFLIQTRGPQAGLTALVQARVSASPPAGADQDTWNLHIELTCEDSTRVTAELSARRDDWRIRHFETRTHTADVQGLLRAGAVGA